MSFFSLLLSCALAPSVPADKEQASLVDLADVHGSYLGFGIGIHPGDVIYEKAFDELSLEFVRTEFGPLWYELDEKVPSDVSVEVLHEYVKRNYNGDAYDRLEGARYAEEFLRARDIKIVLVHFELPYHWRVDKETGLFRSEYVDDLARFYTAHLLYLKDNGISIDYIELANEPDGHWNGHLPPADYVRLLKLCDTLFERYALGDVQILGPGLAFLNLYGQTPAYMDAIMQGGLDSLDGWSTHTWDEVEFLSSNPEYSYGVWQPFLDGIQRADTGREKPIFVTEFGSDVTQYGGIEFASPRVQKGSNLVDSWEYAIRVVANSISHLNRGANALILYRLSNAHWHKTGWGIMQPEDKNTYTRKPVYHAVSQIIGELPLGTAILKPSWYTPDDSILYTIFHSPEKREITLLLVNWTTGPAVENIRFDGLGTLKLMGHSGLAESGSFHPEIEPPVLDRVTIGLPSQSISRIQLCY